MKTFLSVCLGLFLFSGLAAQKLIAFKNEQGKWGYKEEKTGVVTIAPQYEEARGFKGLMDIYSYAAVRKNGKWGVIDKEANVILDFVHDKISNYKGYFPGIITVQEGFIILRDNKWCVANESGLYKCSDPYVDNFNNKLEKLYKEDEKRGWSLEEDDGRFDEEKAFARYKEEAARGDEEAMQKLGEIYLGSALGEVYVGGAKEFLKQIKNEAEAFRWFKKAADKSNQGMSYQVAKMYLEGVGTVKNIPEGFRMMKNVAEKGSTTAMVYLGNLYLDGIGTAVNQEEAFRLFKTAADKGNLKALISLGSFYTNEGPRKNLNEAYSCFKKVSDKGDPEGHYYTGLCYYYGTGTDINIKEAIKYLKWAEKKYRDDPDYWNILAYCYFEQGNVRLAMERLSSAMNVDPSYANAYDSKGEMFLAIGDTSKAAEYYQKAASMGYQNAIDWLKKNNFSLTAKKSTISPSVLENAKEEIVYYNNNWISAIGLLYNGKRVGEWHFYYSTGKGRLWAIENYNEEGTLEGTSKRYYANGSQSYLQTYRNGRLEGAKTIWHPNGRLAGTEEYVNGKFVRLGTWYDDKGAIILSNGTGYVTTYADNGTMDYRGSYKQNSRDGKSQWYYDNGQLKEEVLYKASANAIAGLRWEIIAVYDRNGKALDKGTLKDGNGTWNSYDANGQLSSVRTFQNGILVKTEEYKDGKLVKTTNH